MSRLLLRLRDVGPWPGYTGLLLVALVGAFAISLGLVAATGSSPMSTLADLLDGSVNSLSGTATLVNDAAPLLLVAAGTVVAGRAGLVNVGQEGQVLVGALAGAAFGLKVAGSGVVGDVGILVASALGGACWVGIAALLKVKARINETVSTLLLNYVAVQLVGFLVSKESLLQAKPGSHPVTPALPGNGLLPILANGNGFALSSGIVIAVVVAAAFVVVLRSTRFGYEVRVFGLNPSCEESFGISRQRLVVTSLLVSGATAGLAGGVLLSLNPGGVTPTFSGGVGWEGLLVALVAAYNPIAILPVAVGFGALSAGGSFVVASGVDATIAAVFEGMVALAVLVPQAVLAALRRRRVAPSTGPGEVDGQWPPPAVSAELAPGDATRTPTQGAVLGSRGDG